MTKSVKLISIGHKNNFITFEEEFQSYSMMTNQKDTIEYLKKYGAEIINVYTDFNELDEPKYLRRAAKIAKQSGYKNNVTLKTMYQEQDNVKVEWTEISGQFVRSVQQ